MTAFERMPDLRSALVGRRILVTRPREQAGSFEHALTELGAEVVRFPTVEILPLSDNSALDKAIRSLGEYDWIIFTSANGVRHFLQRCQLLGEHVGSVSLRVGAIGPETARALERQDIAVHLVPREYRAEGILEGLEPERVRGSSFLLARVAGARDVLPNTLRRWGGVVDVVETYRSRPVKQGGERLAALLGRREVDCVTFTSSSTVSGFLDLLSEEDIGRLLSSVAIACIGPITAKSVRSRGLTVQVEAREYTVDGLIRALVEYYAVRDSGKA